MFLDKIKALAGGPKGPPAAQHVARRALALFSVVTCGMVRSSGDTHDFKSDTVRTGIWAYLTTKEKDFIAGASPSQQDLIEASWRLEALGTLIWALQMTPWMPPFEEQFTADVVQKLTRDKSDDLVAGAALRPRDKIEKLRTMAELWHWRARTRQLIEEGRPFPPVPQCKSYDDVVRMTARALKEGGEFSEIIDEDFPVHGKAYRDLTADEYSTVRSITVERHYALNWLCGMAPGNNWDKTPTNT